MKRSAFLYVSGATVAAASFPDLASAAESDIALKTSTGTIFGTLSLPAGQPPWPVTLIIPGSGPTDRDGNSALLSGKNDTYKLLAAALASGGVASVRFDKRAIGASSGAAPAGGEAALRFDDYVDDAVGWLHMLAGDRRFSRNAVVGHSEGALIGLLAALRGPTASYVSLEGAGRPAYTVLREQLKPKLTTMLYSQADAILTALQDGKTLPIDASSPLGGVFRDSVQPYLISWFKYDPAVEIAKLRAPATIVEGTADVQITLDDAHALAKGDPKAKLVVVDGMNHMLKHAPDTSSEGAILTGYTDPSLPVEPKVVQAVKAAAGVAG